MKKALLIFPIAGLLLVALAAAQVSQDISVTASVQPYISVVFNYNAVDFGAVYPGEKIPAPGNAQGAYNVSIKTNTPLVVSAIRTDWTPSVWMPLWFGVQYDIPLLAPQDQIGIETPIQIGPIDVGEYIHYHGYWLDVPIVSPGNYSTTVTITYQPA